jgi:hypothetical protein
MNLEISGSSAYTGLVRSDWSADIAKPPFELDQLEDRETPMWLDVDGEARERAPAKESWLIRGWLNWNYSPCRGSAFLWVGVLIGAAISGFGFLVSG